MQKYRCPYCKEVFPGQVPSTCPSCGKTMLRSVKTPSALRISRRKAKERIWRDCEQQKEALRSSISGSFRIPKKGYIAIVVFLFVLGMFLISSTDRAKERRLSANSVSRTMKSVDALAQALARYRYDTGAFPSAEDGLVALVRDPGVKGWRGPYVNQVRNDIWSKAYVYAPPAAGAPRPTLYSCGPDRMPETDDDIHPAAERFAPTAKWLAEREAK